MSVGRMSLVSNADHYFTIAVDECSDWRMNGILFHERVSGICFGSVQELILNIDQILDDVGSPKQTLQMRCFPGIIPSDFTVNRYSGEPRKGNAETFTVCIQYRYHAGWQGTVSWRNGEKREAFESELQLLQLIKGGVNRTFPETGEEGGLNSCHLTVADYDLGKFIGGYQSISANKTRQFHTPVDLASTLQCFMEGNGTGLSSDLSMEPGIKASFSIKIMYRERATWQGVVYWREGREQLSFRSFKELLHMVTLAVESDSSKVEAVLQ
ncbi:MAG: hypothetical protein QM657_13695 [Lacrimispora sp.]|uniref:hypothetical protein n=1 Tax=Lacrimispora sp. TaxID=2719234 RepID=UPI0039E54D74